MSLTGQSWRRIAAFSPGSWSVPAARSSWHRRPFPPSHSIPSLESTSPVPLPAASSRRGWGGRRWERKTMCFPPPIGTGSLMKSSLCATILSLIPCPSCGSSSPGVRIAVWGFGSTPSALPRSTPSTIPVLRDPAWAPPGIRSANLTLLWWTASTSTPSASRMPTPSPRH